MAIGVGFPGSEPAVPDEARERLGFPMLKGTGTAQSPEGRERPSTTPAAVKTRKAKRA